MQNSKLIDVLKTREVSVSLENILDNAKAASGGDRDLNFLKFLLDHGLLLRGEAMLKRSSTGINEEYYLERYKKMNFESDKHFLCRAEIQNELKRLHINSLSGMDIGNMDILRSNSNYDIVTEDFSSIIDIGLTPARNFFRGLTDIKVKNYLITTFFDDYMDDIIFSTFSRSNDEDFVQAVRDYHEGFKDYTPNPQVQDDSIMFYNQP